LRHLIERHLVLVTKYPFRLLVVLLWRFQTSLVLHAQRATVQALLGDCFDFLIEFHLVAHVEQRGTLALPPNEGVAAAAGDVPAHSLRRRSLQIDDLH